jgi:superfamily II DNA or RNA helicase
MLKDLDLLPVYDSADHDLMKDLIVPLLENAVTYIRGVGFFTSGWLRVAAHGLVSLVERGGHAQYVVSPILEKEDWNALQRGDQAKEDDIIRRALQRDIDGLASSLENDTRDALAWLVADDLLQFRFAVPRVPGTVGDYHDKVGIFIDKQGDMVAIHGSFNDTVGGTLNGEAFSVFKSWVAGQLPFVQRHHVRLTKLWLEGNAQFVTRGVPDAVREQFIRLRTSLDRPYSLPNGGQARTALRGPHCPVTLRDFQAEAIGRWRDNACRGILEMATGTGKTKTALAAAVDRYSTLGRLALIITVPYLHLLEQWARNCRQFGFLPVFCSGEHRNWQIEAKSQISDFRLRALSQVCLIAVHNTAATSAFAETAERIPPEYCLFVADEAHALGAVKLQSALLPGVAMRMGLTATPHRWYDEAGTEVLMKYFSGVAYEYPLEKAIGKCLVPYEYHPMPVNLTEDEETEFRRITDQIVSLRGLAQSDPQIEETIELLLIKRARLVAAARQKLPALIQKLRTLVEQERASGHEIRNVLVYCAPGTHSDVLTAVGELGLRCHEFVHTVDMATRERVLEQFASGDIQVLVAIKCLDEGVDVPSIQTAFFLASTTNPREFIQRRGRVLRLAEGKRRAVLFDFIVTPGEGCPLETGQSLLKREMPRFAEFASAALNEFEARSKLHDIVDHYGMLNLFDERPWDVYRRLVVTKDIPDHFRKEREDV